VAAEAAPLAAPLLPQVSLVIGECDAQLIAHVLGCGWFFLADINSGERLTWAHEFDLHQPDTDISTKYFTSLYWAFVTVTTVGYGDIVPRTDAERVYVIICTFIGNSMFAFMIGKITSLASQMDASQALYTEKMDAVVRAVVAGVFVARVVACGAHTWASVACAHRMSSCGLVGSLDPCASVFGGTTTPSGHAACTSVKVTSSASCRSTSGVSLRTS